MKSNIVWLVCLLLLIVLVALTGLATPTQADKAPPLAVPIVTATPTPDPTPEPQHIHLLWGQRATVLCGGTADSGPGRTPAGVVQLTSYGSDVFALECFPLPGPPIP